MHNYFSYNNFNMNFWYNFSVEMKPMLKESMQQLRVETPEFEGNEVYFVSVEDSRDE